jgi:ABC-2 type transport system ATP-binding protein
MIDIQNVSFHYKKQYPLFDGLSLSLQAGSITGLLGKNGAGKTTLLKLIAGLVFPKSGSIEVMAHSPKKRLPSFLSGVFFVPEEFYLPSIPVKTYVSVNSAFYPKFDEGLMTRLLSEFELDPKRFIDQMSYGQKKKFLISFGLATKCRLLILDEPTNGLDIPSKALFRKVMAGALDEEQLVLISTHQVKDVETLIDRIIILDHGKFILEKDMLEISKQLQFSKSHTGEGGEVLYSESVPGGYKVITSRQDGNTSIDIELLFNAVTTGKQIF